MYLHLNKVLVACNKLCLIILENHVYIISIIDLLDQISFSTVRQRSRLINVLIFISYYNILKSQNGDELLVFYISGQYRLELQELRPRNVHEQKTNYTKEWSEKRQIYGK